MGKQETSPATCYWHVEHIPGASFDFRFSSCEKHLIMKSLLKLYLAFCFLKCGTIHQSL